MYDKYIGIPYKENGRDETGIDCWGLARLFYKQELNIELPSYTEEYTGSSDPKVLQAINYYKDNWVKTVAPKIGDLCLFNILGEPTHVGVYLENNRFLHARQGQTSAIESTKSIQWNKRLEGIYCYQPQSNVIQLAGIPHPFKTNRIFEFASPGITLEQCVNYISEKYSISQRLLKQIVIAIDGIVIHRDSWASTILRAGQLVTYKILPQGGNVVRTLLFIAVAYFTGVYVEGAMTAANAAAAAEGTAAVYSSFQIAAAKFAATAAAMALVNAIVPIKMPTTETPTTGKQLSSFNGTSNRGNPYGAIPVVLGRVRMTPLLGSQPYVDTQTSTSFLHMQLVWGIGPLEVDMNELYVGANKIDYYYQDNVGGTVPSPVTVMGYTSNLGVETETAKIAQFNAMYPNIVEQQYKNVELVNDAGTNNEEVVTFTETQATRVRAIISFPEGLRKISTIDGSSRESKVTFEINLERVLAGGTTAPVANWATGQNFTDTLSKSIYTTYISDYTGDYSASVQLYQKTAYCLTERNGIVAIRGTPSETLGANPSNSTILALKGSAPDKLIAVNNKYFFEPIIPSGYKVLYYVVNRGTDALITTNEITKTYYYSGFTLVSAQQLASGVDYEGTPFTSFTGTWNITISPGALQEARTTALSGAIPDILPGANNTLPLTTTIWTTRSFTNKVDTTSTTWGPTTGSDRTFMNTYAVWSGANLVGFDQTMAVYFPFTGYYTVEAAVDYQRAYIWLPSADEEVQITIPDRSYYSRSIDAPFKTSVYIQAGNRNIRVKAGYTGSGSVSVTPGSATFGVAVKITFNADNAANYVVGTNYVTIGENQFNNYKDGFNYPIDWSNLVPGQYRVKIRRITTSNSDYEGNFKHTFRTTFLSAAAFKSGTSIVPPIGIGICRTGLILESSGKVNGTVDGVNALVQSRGYDYITLPDNSKKWVADQLIDNPASLFIYVLTHPANAYRIEPSQMHNYINMQEIARWHEFCATPVANRRPALTYNGVVADTTSVLSILREICAAGMASPVFIDGKWSVVIDEEKPFVIQHFTPQNSWGFEAVKNLPKLPDAFRITFSDERNAFQSQEILVANYGKTVANARIIEELPLPGITRVEQARYFARWHFLQLKYRPEVFTLNTDFEYLVCTRGDRVRVTHDVPQWGVGSGRITTISANKRTLTLSEPVTLSNTKTYEIIIRKDTTTVNGINQTLVDSQRFTLTNVVTTGIYTTVTIAANQVLLTAKVGDLFMLGELNKVTEDLLVQTIEPTSNTSAKITLVTYSDQMYLQTLNPFSDTAPYYQSYTPVFTKRIASELVQNSIVGSPTIFSVASNDNLSVQVANGSYQNAVVITWQNAIDLPVVAEKVEFQIITGVEEFTETKQAGIYLANKDATSYTVLGLTRNTVYKIRARYKNSAGTISGPWGTAFSHLVEGKSINYYNAAVLTLDLQRTTIVAKPTHQQIIPSNFKHFEFKLIKDTNNNITTDFWNSAGTITFTGVEQGIIDLRNVPSTSGARRISDQGIWYRVACRATDNTNDYSSTSVIASILVKTIR